MNFKFDTTPQGSSWQGRYSKQSPFTVHDGSYVSWLSAESLFIL